MNRKNERPPRQSVYDTRTADFLTRTGWMCRKKLVSAVRAATLSLVGRPWRNTDPQSCATNARTGFAESGVALTDRVPSYAQPASSSDPEGLAVALLGVDQQAPLWRLVVPGSTGRDKRCPVDRKKSVGCDLDVHPVHGPRRRPVEVRRIDEVPAAVAWACPAVGESLVRGPYPACLCGGWRDARPGGHVGDVVRRAAEVCADEVDRVDAGVVQHDRDALVSLGQDVHRGHGLAVDDATGQLLEREGRLEQRGCVAGRLREHELEGLDASEQARARGGEPAHDHQELTSRRLGASAHPPSRRFVRIQGHTVLRREFVPRASLRSSVADAACPWGGF